MKLLNMRITRSFFFMAFLVAAGALSEGAPDLAAAQILPGPIPVPYPPEPPQPNVFDGGNRWLITAYNDASTVHQQMATQGICFLAYSRSGTHIGGIWFSDTFPDWNGRYSQEGDRVILHGDYARAIGHDGILIELFAGTSRNDGGAGQWTEWREDARAGQTVVFANARLRRVGSCPIVQLDPAQAFPSVSPRYKIEGGVAENPLDLGQEPLPEELELLQ